jgi:hypothetical protein
MPPRNGRRRADDAAGPSIGEFSKNAAEPSLTPPTTQAGLAEIVVTPVGRHGRFEAQLLGNRVILESSRQPLLDSARVLLAEGRKPPVANCHAPCRGESRRAHLHDRRGGQANDPGRAERTTEGQDLEAAPLRRRPAASPFLPHPRYPTPYPEPGAEIAAPAARCDAGASHGSV